MRFRPPCRLALAPLLCLCLAVSIPAIGEGLETWTPGRAPELRLKDTQGRWRSLDEFRGNVVIVNFWATWCEPCIAEMPSLQAFKSRFESENLVVVGVNLGEAESRISLFTDRAGTNFPILLDRDGVAKKDWKVNGVPATFVLDAAGRARYRVSGALDFADSKLTAPIERLLRRDTK